MAQLYRGLVGHSQLIQSIRHLVSQVSHSDANVLILGESGTGKDVVARTIHASSKRAHKPFVAINCGAIPEELLEAELFGVEKGAFPGLLSERMGRFEAADGGTLFLDEIGDMPQAMQVKLLRVLEERCVERMGGAKCIKVDVRIIAATHCNLELAIANHHFREDLYYRLNVFPIEMPTLRSRSEDIGLLIDEMIHRLTEQGQAIVNISADALRVLKQYPWPGNIRELSNLIERLTILYPNQKVEAKHLPACILQNDKVNTPLLEEKSQTLIGQDFDLKAYLEKLEIDLILKALELSDWVVSHAAEKLKMRRTTLVERMKKFKLIKEEEPA